MKTGRITISLNISDDDRAAIQFIFGKHLDYGSPTQYLKDMLVTHCDQVLRNARRMYSERVITDANQQEYESHGP